MSPSNEPREQSDRDLPALIQGSVEPIVLESYHAGWDRPWRGLSAEAWAELAREFGERFKGARIETGKNREFAQRHGLEIIPAVLVLVGGEEVARFTGHVLVEDVIRAVHAALALTNTRQSARQELEDAGASRDVIAPVRSLLRRRTNETSAPLARTG